ncbi:MAG: YjfB family protein [Bacillota bacterium]
MRIGGVTMPVREADSRNIINIMMIKKSMEAMKENGNDIKRLMEQSVTPNLGKHIDVKV